MEMVLSLLLLVLGFVMLVKGADRFVDGASDIAGRLGIPQLVIGLTIVAMGTSAPEAAVSITAALKGNADITIGNIVGSNILNILIILGLSSVVAPLAVSAHTLFRDIPFMIAITLLLLFQGTGGNIGLWEGVVLTILFLAYVSYLLWMSKKNGFPESDGSAPGQEHPSSGPKAAVSGTLVAASVRKGRLWQPVLSTLAGLAMIVLGSRIAVDAATDLARLFGMSERFIGLTIVAMGTSLPDLAASVAAARKGNTGIAVGNVIGSCVFNAFMVLGAAAAVRPLPFGGIGMTDLVTLAGASVLFWLFGWFFRKRTITRWEGGVMILCYIAYITYLVLAELGKL